MEGGDFMPYLSLTGPQLPKALKEKLARELTEVVYNHLHKDFPMVTKEEILLTFNELPAENAAKGGVLVSELLAGRR